MDINKQTIDLAIQETARNYLGGAKALGKAIGANPRTFTNKCNPKEQHVLTVEETLALMRVSGDFRLLDAIAEEAGYICVRIEANESLSDTHVLISWTGWYAQLGELSSVVAKALLDGQITLEEYHAVRSRMFDEFTREIALLHILDQHLVPMNCPLLSDLQVKPVAESIDSAIEVTVSGFSDFTDLSAKLNLREGTLKRKLDFDDVDISFNIHEIRQLMAVSNNYGILYTLADFLGFGCINVKNSAYETSDQELLNVWSACAREKGETASSIDEVLNTAVPSELDIKEICEEMFEDFKYGVALLNRLKSMSQDDSINNKK